MISPSTFVVGAGPVATTLAGALRRGGVPVLGLWARRPEQARKAAALAGVAAFSSAPPDLLLEADAVIIAVRDDAIADAARMLVDTGLITARHVFVHCSGAISGGEAFAGVHDALGGVAVMHPLRAIAEPSPAIPSLDGTVFGVEGDEPGLAVVRALVAAIGGRGIELDGAQMAAYHAAAAIASNYSVALLDAASAVLERAGIARADALAALVPLVDGTLANLRAHGLPGGLTGPIRRGDRATVQRHLDALTALSPDLMAIYRVLGRRTLALARECGDASTDALDAIEALLADPR